MKNFFLSLFFGKMILLTPNPIDIHNQWVDIELKKPITAINIGATVDIELSYSKTFSDKVKSQQNISKYLKEIYPEGMIEAVLSTKDNKSIMLINNGFYTSGYGEKEKLRILIKLTSQSQIPTGKKFTSLKIRSQTKLEQVLVHWKNFSK